MAEEKTPKKAWINSKRKQQLISHLHMELFLEHPRETLDVLQSSIKFGFIPSVLFVAASVRIVKTSGSTDDESAIISDLLFGYHIIRLAMQVIAFPIRWILYRNAKRLLRIEVREHLIASILEMFSSWPWKVYISLGEVMTMFMVIGLILAAFCGWGDLSPDQILNARLHMAQTTFQIFYGLFTTYRFGNAVLEQDGLQQLRSAQGVSNEELIQFTQLFKFKCLEASDQAFYQQSGCDVCYGQYSDEEEVRRLPCHHLYHGECIGTWLKSKSVCPTCQHDIKQPYTQKKNPTSSNSNSNIPHPTLNAEITNESPKGLVESPVNANGVVYPASPEDVVSSTPETKSSEDEATHISSSSVAKDSTVESRLARRNVRVESVPYPSESYSKIEQEDLEYEDVGDVAHSLASPTSAQFLLSKSSVESNTGNSEGAASSFVRV